MLYIISLAGDPARDEQLVASFLDSPEDPMLARLALETLTDWDLGQRYREQVLRFIRGVEWDVEDEGQARQMAMFCAGTMLRQGVPDHELASELIDMASAREADSLDRQDALRSLARALNYDWEDMPRSSRTFDPDNDWSCVVLKEARRRYGSTKANGHGQVDRRAR